MLKSMKQNEISSECDKESVKSNIVGRNFRCEMNNGTNGSGSESESEIDLTTTGSPKNFVLVNGCIDFSNNNNNNNSDK